MRKKKAFQVVLAKVKDFDPNRPDLQEFLNQIAAEAMSQNQTADCDLENSTDDRSDEVRRCANLLGRRVKLMRVIFGQGETADPDENEHLLCAHVGETGGVVAACESSVWIEFEGGVTAWAIPEEVSLDLESVASPTPFKTDQSPEHGTVKCPVCGCELKAANLTRHLQAGAIGVCAKQCNVNVSDLRRLLQKSPAKKRVGLRRTRKTGSKKFDVRNASDTENRVWRAGSGQTRKHGSRRDNSGHR